MSYLPPQVMFASTTAKADRPDMKDSLAHIVETGVFCVNIASAAMKQQMSDSSATLPAGISEFEACGIASAECDTIDCLRVADAPASLECRMTQVQRLAGQANWLVLGVVTGVHLRDDCIREGRFDLGRDGWLARMGYRDYVAVHEVFELERPE